MTFALTALGALLVLVFGAGCSRDDGSNDDPALLVGVPWVLSAGVEVEGWETVAPSVTFDGKMVGGSNGCNQYGASYTVDGNVLEIGEIAQTLRACPPPAGAVETEYMAAFQRVAAWRMGEYELVLADSDEHELLRFRAATPEGSWLATGLLRESDNTLVSPLAGTEITAVLDEDGALAGSTGCNRYTTAYTAERGSIEIAPPTVTELACTEPDGVMEQESAYLALLARVERYRVDGASLALLDTDGTTLVTFQRAQR